MQIQVDEEGKKAIVMLADAALKIGGIQNLQGVNTIMQSMKDIPVKKKAEK